MGWISRKIPVSRKRYEAELADLRASHKKNIATVAAATVQRESKLRGEIAGLKNMLDDNIHFHLGDPRSIHVAVGREELDDLHARKIISPKAEKRFGVGFKDNVTMSASVVEYGLTCDGKDFCMVNRLHLRTMADLLSQKIIDRWLDQNKKG